MIFKNFLYFFLLVIPQALIAATLFQENFNDQADWMPSGSNSVSSLPENWDYARTDENWHPEEITGSQPFHED